MFNRSARLFLVARNTLLYRSLIITLVAYLVSTSLGNGAPLPTVSASNDSAAPAATHRLFFPFVTSGMISSPIIPKRSRVVITAQASKISQLVGDYDKERQTPTQNLTQTRYQLLSTDLGVPFRHNGKTFVLFGDSFGGNGGDAIAYTTDSNLNDGLNLQFITDAQGIYRPIIIPGISQGGFEVPTEGVSVNGRMYIYHTTDSSGAGTMGRSVVAVSDNDGQTFTYLYDLSRQYFINVSVVQVESGNWPGVPQLQGPGLMMFGSGTYRQSNVYLAYQPSTGINSASTVRYFAGLNAAQQPTWSTAESASKPLFNQPCVGEFSVSYNAFIGKWIMLYNCVFSDSRGIVMRTADYPWGPWSAGQILFRPWEDNGYCHFMHTSWTYEKCDNVYDAGHENEWGGEYGPYQFEDAATGSSMNTTIYFTMSTWNPYTVVLMKASLRAEPY